MKNIYKVRFFAKCPVNGIRIRYELAITSKETIMVEKIIDAVDKIGAGFHEDICEILFKEFGGSQVLVANHHGVEIRTERG